MVVFFLKPIESDKKNSNNQPYRYETSLGYRYYPLFDLDDMFLINVEKRQNNDVFYHLESFFNT